MFVNKVIYNNGVLIDLSNDTVTPDMVKSGVRFHAKDGQPQRGSAPFCGSIGPLSNIEFTSVFAGSNLTGYNLNRIDELAFAAFYSTDFDDTLPGVKSAFCVPDSPQCGSWFGLSDTAYPYNYPANYSYENKTLTPASGTITRENSKVFFKDSFLQKGSLYVIVLGYK